MKKLLLFILLLITLLAGFFLIKTYVSVNPLFRAQVSGKKALAPTQIINKQNSANDPVLSKIDRTLDQTLLAIPEDRLFRYLDGNKIPLSRKMSKYGISFKKRDSREDCEMYVYRKFLFGIRSSATEDEIKQMCTNENIKCQLFWPSDKNSYSGETTNLSAYPDALEISNYLYEKYKDNLLRWAEPDFLMIGCIKFY